MAFDPDSYLASKKTAFNPDAYLASKGAPIQAVNNIEEPVPQQDVGAFDLVTGESRMTPQMESLQEVGGAPELNEMSMGAFKASLGLMTTGKTDELKSILSQQFGDNISFEDDEKGNTLVNLPSGQFALNKPGLSGQDVVRGLFDFAAFTPAGRATSLPAAFAKNALTEATIEGAEASVGGEFSGEDVAIAGGIGGTLKGVENVVGNIHRVTKGSSENEIVNAGRRSEIEVLTSDINSPKNFVGKTAQQTAEKIPIFGTGARREVQQESREGAVNKVIDKYGEFSYSAIVDSLKSQKGKIKNAAGSVLEATGKKLDAFGEVNLLKTNESIKFAKDELSKKGVIQSSSALDDLSTLVDTIAESPQSFTMLKENSTAFREIINGADKAERSQLTSRAKSLLQQVQSSIRVDMTNFAKENLTPQELSKWQKANTVYANEATKLTKTRLKTVLDKGDIEPESVKNMLFSQKPSEVRNLYKSLTPAGRSNARSAIVSKAVTDLSKRANGLTPNAFVTEMKKQGLQIDVFFKGEERKQLSGLIKALNATKRAQDAAVTTPTGQQILGAGTLAAAATDLGTTLLTGSSIGAISRLYESAPVRNALLRLDSIPPRSDLFLQALSEFQSVLNATAQSLDLSERDQ